MKKLIVLILSFVLFYTAKTQNLDLLYAEKFDFKEVLFDNATGFDPAIMCNDTTDLSYYDVGLDPMGIAVGSIFFADGPEAEYAGTFRGASDLRLLDVNVNDNTDHQTILLDLNGPCSYEDGGGEVLNFSFPMMENMTGIINFSDESGQDSFWSTYILSTELIYQHLWSVGDLTLISGSAVDDDLKYVNPDSTVVDLEVYSGFDHYIIAIDEFGFYQWSYLTDGLEFDLGNVELKGIVEMEDGIMLVLNQAHLFDALRSSKIIYLDYEGNEIRDAVELYGILIQKIEQDTNGFTMAGFYNEDADNTNLDLGGGEFILEEAAGLADGFLIQYDSDGHVDWWHTLRGPSFNTIISFDISEDHVFLTGQMSADGVFYSSNQDSLKLDNLEDFRLYISKLSLDGTIKWVVPFESQSAAGSNIIEVDGENIALYGWYGSDLDADPNTSSEYLLSKGNPDLIRSFYYIYLKENPLSTTSYRDKNVYLRPNPVSSYLSTGSSDIKILEVLDLTGRIVGKYQSSEIDVSALQNGTYIVKMEVDGEWISELISIVH